ncbi:MAG: iron chelate uptake ABC transporter family permease subunit [Terrisporobacter sp.]
MQLLLVGGCLATGGSVVQSVDKNELASPYTLGVSSGASLGAGLIMSNMNNNTSCRKLYITVCRICIWINDCFFSYSIFHQN